MTAGLSCFGMAASLGIMLFSLKRNGGGGMNRLRVGIYGVRRALNIMRRGLAGNLAQIVAVTDPDAELVRNTSDEISSLGAAS